MIKVGLSVLAGLAVFLIVKEAVVLALIIDTNPLQCISRIGYQVPCWEGFPFAAGLAAAAVVGLLAWLVAWRVDIGTKHRWPRG
jgi:hypothetical protein